MHSRPVTPRSGQQRHAMDKLVLGWGGLCTRIARSRGCCLENCIPGRKLVVDVLELPLLVLVLVPVPVSRRPHRRVARAHWICCTLRLFTSSFLVSGCVSCLCCCRYVAKAEALIKTAMSACDHGPPVPPQQLESDMEYEIQVSYVCVCASYACMCV